MSGPANPLLISVERRKRQLRGTGLRINKRVAIMSKIHVHAGYGKRISGNE